MTEPRSSRVIRWAPVVAAVVTTASMIFAVTTYWRGEREHRQASAIGILQDYLKFSVEHPDLASRTADAPLDARYDWFAAHTLFTVESLFILVGEDERWKRTLEVILRPHRKYLEEGKLSCGAFDAGFLQFLKDRFPDFKCGQ